MSNMERRSSMAATSGSFPRRRHRTTTTLRHSAGLSEEAHGELNDTAVGDDDDNRMIVSSLLSSAHRRNHTPATARVSKQTPTLKLSHQMIGVSVPRKARSASGKRSSHEYGSSGNGSGVGEEHNLQQLSSRKKMKTIGSKTRPPKSSKCSSGLAEENIEIEIAEVLSGLKKQSQSSKDQDDTATVKTSTPKLGAKDQNGISDDFKTSPAEAAVEVVESEPPEKLTNAPEEGASGSMESHKEEEKVAEANPFTEISESVGRDAKLHADLEDSTGTKGISTGSKAEKKREDTFEFDLMAPPSMEKEEMVEKFVLEKLEEKKVETIHENPNQDSGKLEASNCLVSQPSPKRCATHHYIARNIYLHQQVAKMNNSWPTATTSAPLCGTKPENMVIGNSFLGSISGPNLRRAHEKEQAVSNFSGHGGIDRSLGGANFIEVSQRKQLVVQQAPQPASASNLMNGPPFIFPMGQHQAAVMATSNQSGPLKYAKSTNNASMSSHSAARPLGSSSTPMEAAVNFNNPNKTGKEGPYLAINGYPFPISTPTGTTPAFRGGNAAQAVPFFNGPFCSNQMFHPSQLQQQQPHLQLQQQIQLTHQNTSTSNDSSSSHKQPESQKLRETQFSSNNFLTLQQSQMQYVPPSLQSCKLESEINGENTASPADNRASHAQKSVYGQNFAVPFQPMSFTLTPYVTLGGGGGGGSGSHIEQSHQKGLKGGVELLSSKAFGMSFGSLSGNNGTGSCLNFSSMAQDPAIFQSLPDMARQGYKVGPAPQAAQQKNHQISERKSTGGSSNNPDDGLKAAASKKSSSTTGQTLFFDNSARTLNFMSSPVTGSWPPRSIAPSTTITTNAPPVDGNTSSSNTQQQHLFQFQLQKAHMLQQQQPAMAARSKAPNAAKFPNNAPVFSQALIQCNTSVQSPQLKSSNVKSFPKQQRRASQGQTQISFGGNLKPSLAPPQGQHILPNNQSLSNMVSAGGKACLPVSTLQSQQTENSPTGNGQMSSPACGRNIPSILSTCPTHLSELKY